MNFWLTLTFVSLVHESSQVARFIRLPDGYAFMPSTNFLSLTRVPTLKDCGITATIAELKSGNVGGYIFSQSDPNCEVYTSVVKITYDGYSGGSDAWYVKITDDVTYEAKCADLDVKRLVKALNGSVRSTVVSLTSTKASLAAVKEISTSSFTTTARSTAVSSTATRITTPSFSTTATSKVSVDVSSDAHVTSITAGSTTKTTLPTTKITTAVTKRTTPAAEACQAVDQKEATIFVDDSSQIILAPYQSAFCSADCACSFGKSQFYPTGTKEPGAQVAVTCPSMTTLCVIDESGAQWTAGIPAPTQLDMFPFCEVGKGCHMYLSHSRNWSGPLKAKLQSTGTVKEDSDYWYLPPGPITVGYIMKPLGDPAYIKAAAISCSGCGNIAKYTGYACGGRMPTT